MKSGAVQHSPPDKSQPEPGPWSPVIFLSWILFFHDLLLKVTEIISAIVLLHFTLSIFICFWLQVKRKNAQVIGPYDCTKYSNTASNVPPPSPH